MGVSWFKKLIGKDSSSATTLSIPVTTYPSVIYTSSIIEHIAKSEYESLKRKKVPLQEIESNNRTSSSNPGSTISLILIIILSLAVIVFIFYRKRAKLQANKFSFRQTERKFGSPTSPPTSQIEQNPTFV
ncbi:unnamed protein product [Rotaria sordida]|uniref:Uncharacterized protein n=1 Tax=Rotaria sordida TaxID=392033 RepID=A0A819EV26_9BILA|nr:unnamed protein product [Rotaria sordida]CAF1019348.1 unnamed protein product [Rotaria sordida]CAF1025133.1 unnamed protein product [Rotaria sordida]CAF1026339.1 unnamed protein product [Rotaria sordida]CAF3855956.1 unnamed protein product [Rotaria sordida]